MTSTAPSDMDVRRHPLWWQLAACILIGLAIAWLSIGDARVRLANTILDDNPVVFSYFLVDSARFSRDVLSTYGEVFGKATIQNWLPAILLGRFGLDPHLSSVAVVVLQHVLLALAMFLLAIEMTGSRATGWMTVLFAFAALPWRWNLAAYGSIMPWPYPGHLVMPLLLFAMIALLRARVLLLIVLLVGASLVHPAMTLCGVAVAGLYYLDEWRVDRQSASLARAISLAIPIVACVAPALLLTTGGSDLVSRSELMYVLRNNGHMNPLQSVGFLHTVVPTVAGFLILVVLAVRSTGQARRQTSDPARRVDRLWFAAAAAMLILSAAHAVAMIVGVPRVAQIAGTRSSLMFVMIVLPLVIHYLRRNLHSESVATRWAAAAILVLLALQQYGVFVGPLLALVLVDFFRSHGDGDMARGVGAWDRTQRTATIVLVAWVVAIVGAGLIGAIGGGSITGRPILAVLAPGTYLDAKFVIAVGVITAAALAPYVMGRRSGQTGFSGAVAVVTFCLCGITALHAINTGRETREPLARANYAAQRWARSNTRIGSLFLIAEQGLPWRTESLRSAVRLEPDWFYLYSGSRSAKQRYHELPEQLRRSFADDSIGLIHAFARTYGADYIVTRRDVQLELTAAYRNDMLTVYVARADTAGP